uniref:Uncharacterized protein n=1 Tax=Meloidogyne enterolobii TaxID=390850 RepID=A0A6V7VNT7_MELEN|nr:unnamed protein product [Meloidogyne enterolobii]
MRKLNRSLSLIVFLNIGLLLLDYIITYLITGDSTKKQEILSVDNWFISTYLSVIYLVGLAANAPILFINSSDYREAYLKEFNLIKKFFKKIFNNSSTPISVVTRVVNNNQLNQVTPIAS